MFHVPEWKKGAHMPKEIEKRPDCEGETTLHREAKLIDSLLSAFSFNGVKWRGISEKVTYLFWGTAMEQTSWIQTFNTAPEHDRVQADERNRIDCLSEPIPCSRPCRIIDGIRYLIYSKEEQYHRLELHWKASSQPGCENCGKRITTVNIYYWRLFGLCTACYERSNSSYVTDIVNNTNWKKPGGREK